MVTSGCSTRLRPTDNTPTLRSDVPESRSFRDRSPVPSDVSEPRGAGGPILESDVPESSFCLKWDSEDPEFSLPLWAEHWLLSDAPESTLVLKAGPRPRLFSDAPESTLVLKAGPRPRLFSEAPESIRGLEARVWSEDVESEHWRWDRTTSSSDVVTGSQIFGWFSRGPETSFLTRGSRTRTMPELEPMEHNHHNTVSGHSGTYP